MDFFVYLHLLFIALGLGLAVRLDFLFFQGRSARPSNVLLADALQSHQMITTAMFGLWITGLCLLYVRTGFDLALFSPKLWMKLIVVTLLSLNAIVIAKYVLPVMKRFNDRPLLAIPVKFKLPMAVSAATSVLCWFSALALGAMASLKTQSWDILAPLFAVEYGVGLLVAISIALWVRVPEASVESSKQSAPIPIKPESRDPLPASRAAQVSVN